MFNIQLLLPDGPANCGSLRFTVQRIESRGYHSEKHTIMIFAGFVRHTSRNVLQISGSMIMDCMIASDAVFKLSRLNVGRPSDRRPYR